MNKLIYRILLSSIVFASTSTSTSTAPAATTAIAASSSEGNTPGAEGKEGTENKAQANTTSNAPANALAADDMKDVKVETGFKVSPAFKLSAYSINTMDRTTGGIKRTPNASKAEDPRMDIASTTNKDQNFTSVFPVASLAVKLDGEYARGVMTVEARLMKDDAPWSATQQTSSTLYFDETFVNIGRQDSFNLDVGFCDSAAAFAFAGNGKYYRGPDRGVFGNAARYFMWANEINSKFKMLDENTPDTTANASRALPNNLLFFRDNLAGDDWTYQPRWTLWLPELKAGNHKVEFGFGTTLSTEAQDGIYITTGAYDEYSFGEDQKIRFGVGAGISAQTEENLKGMYKRPHGITAGISYHSKAFDIGVKATYNGDSYVKTLSDSTKKALSDAGTLDSNKNPTLNVNNITITDESTKSSINSYTYKEDDATAPMIATVKGRIALIHDYDLTFGAFGSVRDTGFSKDKGSSIKEKCYGLSIGVNGPIPNAPFRYGVELTWMHTENDAKLAEAAASDVISTANETKNVPMVGNMVLASIGVVYSPK